MSEIALSFLAGLLTTLSPCVLPVLPLVVGSAFQGHKYGPVAMACGMIFSFTAIGISISWLGSALGLSPKIIRQIAASLLVLCGFLLLSSSLQEKFVRLSTPLSVWADRNINRYAPGGLFGQFIVGAFLGALWSPCTGPTLGAAVGFATQAETRLRAMMMMFSFGIGATLPLVLVAYGSKRLFLKSREKLSSVGKVGKILFGIFLVVVGGFILTGLDKSTEGLILEILPEWLVKLTTKF